MTKKVDMIKGWWGFARISYYSADSERGAWNANMCHHRKGLTRLVVKRVSKVRLTVS